MNKQGKYFSFIFTLIILYLSFLLIKPFIGALVSAMIISYILYPFYKRINTKIKSKNLSLFLVVLIVIFLVLLPIGLMAYALIDRITGLLDFFVKFDINSIPFITSEMIPIINNYFIKSTENIGSGILKLLTSFVAGLPDKIISIIVFLFATSLFLKDGPNLIKKFKITIPIEKVQKDALIKEFSIVTKSMIYSIFLSAIFSGVLGGLIFYLFSIPSALLWGFVMIILSFIPIIGGTPVWTGGIIYLLLTGQHLLGILLIILAILAEQLNNILMMKIIGKKSKINSFIVLIGIISGIKVFGLLGLILGPLIISLLITLIRFHTKNYKKKFNF